MDFELKRNYKIASSVNTYMTLYLQNKTRSASNKVYQLLAQGRWFSPGTPASSTTKTGRHDRAEILLKVALNTNIQIQIQIQNKSTKVNNVIIVRLEKMAMLE